MTSVKEGADPDQKDSDVIEINCSDLALTKSNQSFPEKFFKSNFWKNFYTWNSLLLNSDHFVFMQDLDENCKKIISSYSINSLEMDEDYLNECQYKNSASFYDECLIDINL